MKRESAPDATGEQVHEPEFALEIEPKYIGFSTIAEAGWDAKGNNVINYSSIR